MTAVRFALAMALVWVAPWRAVRRQRDNDVAFRRVCDVLLLQAERLKRYEPEPRERHLHLVK